MHAAAYRALGMTHTYARLETSAEELPDRVAALRRGELAGLNVTLPHKSRVLAFVDDLHATARTAGAANTLLRTADGRIEALNTDAPALAIELASLADAPALSSQPALPRIPRRGPLSGLILGSGGAARAAAMALADLGVRRALVRARAFSDPAEAERFARDLSGALEIAPAPLVAPGAEPEDLAFIVQATSCGMHGGPPGDAVAHAVHWASVPAGAVALDVVYTPRETPFLRAARARDLACDDGLGMLARQGALAFEAWLGVPAPLDVMRAALEAAP